MAHSTRRIQKENELAESLIRAIFCLKKNFACEGGSMQRRKFLKSIGGITGLAALNIPLSWSQPSSQKTHPYKLYWGDMHCHSGISYGRGALQDAFEAAQEQRLDFCSIVGHSSWHDTPLDEEHPKNPIGKYGMLCIVISKSIYNNTIKNFHYFIRR